MRGVINLMFVAAFLVAFTIFAPAAIEPVGQAVIDTGSLTTAQTENVRSFYDALFIQVPLVAFFGVLAFGVVWYVRRQITVSQQ